MERSSRGQPLRIAYVWDRLLPTHQTDAEQALATVAALARAGARVRVVVPCPPDARPLEAEALCVHYQVSGPFEVSSVPLPLSRQMLLRKALHAWRAPHLPVLAEADVVHTRNAATFVALVRAGFPVLYDTHRVWPDQLPWLRPLLRASMAQPSFLGVACHSRYTRESYLRLGVAPEKTRVVRNGFDPRRFVRVSSREQARARLGLPPDRPIATYAGHIGLLKGIHSILRIARTCPSALFLLVGSVKDGWVERLARQLPNVRVIAWQPYDRVADYLFASDVLLLPPSPLGLNVAGHTVLPMKLYGYLAAGRAILAPATPDLTELLTHDENAVLTPPGDVDAASRALRMLLAAPALRQRLGQRARDAAMASTWDDRAQRLLALMEERLSRAWVDCYASHTVRQASRAVATRG